MKYLVHSSRLLKNLIVGLALLAPQKIISQSSPQPFGASPFEVSQKDMDALYGYLQNLSDEELAEIERESRKILTEMGFDPDTMAPLPNPVQSPGNSMPDFYPAPPKMEPSTAPSKLKVEPIPEPELPQNTINDIQKLIKSLIEHLTSLRLKIASSPTISDRLNRWNNDINDLLYFAKVINKPQHYKRLGLPEFTALLNALRSLEEGMRSSNQKLVDQSTKEALWDDPYEALGVEESSSDDDIENMYQFLKIQIGPDAIRQNMTDEGMPPKDIEKSVRDAELSFEFITDAYEKLKDPASREIIDKERASFRNKQKFSEKGEKQAIDALNSSLSNAIYQQQVLTKLEQFIKKYEPAELELKKNMELEEAARRKEETEFAQRKNFGPGVHHIRETPQYFSGRYTPPQGQSYGGRSPSRPYNAPSSGNTGGFDSKMEKPKQPDAPKPGEKPKDKDKGSDKEKDKEGGKDGSKKPGSKPEGDKSKDKKPQTETLLKKIQDLDQKLFTFNSNFDKGFFTSVAKNTSPADIENSLDQFIKTTKLTDLADSLSYIESELKSLEPKKTQQILLHSQKINEPVNLDELKSAWKLIGPKVKQFKENVELAQSNLKLYKKPSASKSPKKEEPIHSAPILSNAFATDLAALTALSSIDKLESLIAKNREQELIPPLQIAQPASEESSAAQEDRQKILSEYLQKTNEDFKRFNVNFDRVFFKDILEQKPDPEKIEQDLGRFLERSNLVLVANGLAYISDDIAPSIIKKPLQPIIEQTWKHMAEHVANFRQNILLVYDALTSQKVAYKEKFASPSVPDKKSPEESKPEPMVDFKNLKLSQSALGSVSKSLQFISKKIGSKPKK